MDHTGSKRSVGGQWGSLEFGSNRKPLSLLGYRDKMKETGSVVPVTEWKTELQKDWLSEAEASYDAAGQGIVQGRENRDNLLLFWGQTDLTKHGLIDTCD